MIKKCSQGRVIRMKKVSIKQLDEIINVLANGGVVALPADTAYALAADATNPLAAAKVFAIKKRQAGKQLSWFFSDLDQIEKYARLNDNQREVLKKYLPGPYTFILPSKSNGKTLGCRLDSRGITQKVAGAFGKPITATSANISGERPARSVEELSGLAVDLIVDGGKLPVSSSSTVVDLTRSVPVVARRGAGEFPKMV